jgi:hypothetical protein
MVALSRTCVIRNDRTQSILARELRKCPAPWLRDDPSGRRPGIGGRDEDLIRKLEDAASATTSGTPMTTARND